MKRKIVGFSKLFSVAAVAMLLFAGTANAQMKPKLPANQKDVLQTERKLPSMMTDSVIGVGTVTRKSAAVNPTGIGKEVAPGVFEVDPDSVRGKRIMMTGGNQTAVAVCIGKWKDGECKGIYIEW